MNDLRPFLLLFLLLPIASCKKNIEESNSAISLGVDYTILKKTYRETETEGNLLWIETSYFDKNNLLIQTTSGTKYTQFKADSKKIYHYDDEKRVFKFETYRKWTPAGNFQMIYDTVYSFEAGKIKTKTVHDFENKVSAVVELHYGVNGLIKEDINGANNHYWYIYETDNDGKTTKKEMYNDLGLWQTYLYEYNNGKLIKETVIYQGWETHLIEYSYDGNNLVKVRKSEQNSSGAIIPFAMNEYFYNNSGRIIKEIRINNRVSFDPPIYKYVSTYEYRF